MSGKGKMNPAKLKALQAKQNNRGKGVPRRKKKNVRRTGAADEKKLTQSLKRLGVQSLPQCEEATLFRDDGMVIQFDKPKVQAGMDANTYVISGKNEVVSAADVASNGMDAMKQWSDLQQAGAQEGGEADAGDDDEEMPELVSFNNQ